VTGGKTLSATVVSVSTSTKLENAVDQVQTFRYRIIKRAFDCLLAAVGLIPLVLIGAPVALLIFMSTSGPIFYRETRIGRYGKLFRIFKFRTMYVGERRQQRLQQSQYTGLELRSTQKNSRDPRITPVGRILRRWSLDELPQIINVLNGEMSLIGPRPIVDAERKLYGSAFRLYCMALPGLTGLWQVSGRTTLSYEERVLLDCRYVKNWSMKLDLAILFKTFNAVMSAHGAC
jgi:lipopolysaccharide/colanic/teichoic acid biosynthesis glycosyltransferase